MLNIAVLTLLRSARKQDHDVVSIPAVVHPVSGTVVDPKFQEARIKPPVISEVSSTHAVDALLDTGNDIDILLREPFAEGISAVYSSVVKNLNHNTYNLSEKGRFLKMAAPKSLSKAHLQGAFLSPEHTCTGADFNEAHLRKPRFRNDGVVAFDELGELLPLAVVRPQPVLDPFR